MKSKIITLLLFVGFSLNAQIDFSKNERNSGICVMSTTDILTQTPNTLQGECSVMLSSTDGCIYGWSGANWVSQCDADPILSITRQGDSIIVATVKNRFSFLDSVGIQTLANIYSTAIIGTHPIGTDAETIFAAIYDSLSNIVYTASEGVELIGNDFQLDIDGLTQTATNVDGSELIAVSQGGVDKQIEQKEYRAILRVENDTTFYLTSAIDYDSDGSPDTNRVIIKPSLFVQPTNFASYSPALVLTDSTDEATTKAQVEAYVLANNIAAGSQVRVGGDWVFEVMTDGTVFMQNKNIQDIAPNFECRDTIITGSGWRPYITGVVDIPGGVTYAGVKSNGVLINFDTTINATSSTAGTITINPNSSHNGGASKAVIADNGLIDVEYTIETYRGALNYGTIGLSSEESQAVAASGNFQHISHHLYILNVSPTDRRCRLINKTEGANTQLFEKQVVTGEVVRLEKNDQTITFYSNGVQQFQYTDNFSPPTDTTITTVTKSIVEAVEELYCNPSQSNSVDSHEPVTITDAVIEQGFELTGQELDYVKYIPSIPNDLKVIGVGNSITAGSSGPSNPNLSYLQVASDSLGQTINVVLQNDAGGGATIVDLNGSVSTHLSRLDYTKQNAVVVKEFVNAYRLISRNPYDVVELTMNYLSDFARGIDSEKKDSVCIFYILPATAGWFSDYTSKEFRDSVTVFNNQIVNAVDSLRQFANIRIVNPSNNPEFHNHEFYQNNTTDGIHLNDKGNRELANVLYASILKYYRGIDEKHFYATSFLDTRQEEHFGGTMNLYPYSPPTQIYSGSGGDIAQINNSGFLTEGYEMSFTNNSPGTYNVNPLVGDVVNAGVISSSYTLSSGESIKLRKLSNGNFIVIK